MANWDLITRIGTPIITLVVGAVISRVFERRPKLIVYYGHVSSFRVKPAEGPDSFVHAHSVVIRNSGHQAATNVRVSHIVLPEHIDISPSVPYTIEVLPSGNKDLVIPQIVPAQSVTISYLYFPPLTWNATTSAVRCDEGMARVIRVLPARQFPTWVVYSLGGLILFGVGFVVYLLWSLAILLTGTGLNP